MKIKAHITCHKQQTNGMSTQSIKTITGNPEAKLTTPRNSTAGVELKETINMPHSKPPSNPATYITRYQTHTVNPSPTTRILVYIKMQITNQIKPNNLRNQDTSSAHRKESKTTKTRVLNTIRATTKQPLNQITFTTFYETLNTRNSHSTTQPPPQTQHDRWLQMLLQQPHQKIPLIAQPPN
eukprot:gene3308-2290_t